MRQGWMRYYSMSPLNLDTNGFYWRFLQPFFKHLHSSNETKCRLRKITCIFRSTFSIHQTAPPIFAPLIARAKCRLFFLSFGLDTPDLLDISIGGSVFFLILCGILFTFDRVSLETKHKSYKHIFGYNKVRWKHLFIMYLPEAGA